MSTNVKSAFRLATVQLELKSLLHSRDLDPRGKNHQKYKQIAASIASVGVIEPLVVYPAGRGKYRILDGHKRAEILIAKNVKRAECLIATSDEGFTYNKRVNYLSPVGEHQMILRALRHNSQKTIADALNVNVATIRRKQNLLCGICKEAIELLKDRRVSPRVFASLRKMKPIRQIEAAQLMIASNMYSSRFCLALLAGTRDDLLIAPPKDQISRVSPGQKLGMEQETDALMRNLKAVENSYGTEVLTLSVCCRYVGRVLADSKIRQYLKGHHGDLFEEVRDLVTSVESNLTQPMKAIGATARFDAAGR